MLDRTNETTTYLVHAALASCKTTDENQTNMQTWCKGEKEPLQWICKTLL